MTVKALKKKNNMGRSYNLKKSPINKGTAAKPSPVKDFGLISGPIAAALIGSAVSGGIGAVSQSAASKKAEKQQLIANKNAKGDIVKNSMSNLIGN
tara:strand:- start:767 stop:1054 length:288 start_codon:yes stop_codon:yes gene_type:complete